MIAFMTIFDYMVRLSPAVHFIIVFHISAESDIIHPFLIVEIPSYRLHDALLELQGRGPAELPVQARRIDGIPQVMAFAVSHISDQTVGIAFRTSEETVHRLYQHLHNIYVLPLVKASDIVCRSRLSPVEDKVNGSGMVLNIQPVPDILSLSIYRERSVMPYIVYKQRYQLLRELIWTVIVGAVGHDTDCAADTLSPQ